MKHTDQLLLSETARRILFADLEGHGNVLSPFHSAALAELVDTFTSYCAGEAHGRRAFGLPTGLGKTSAICAFLTALHQLGHAVPVAVAASRVEALCVMKRDLMFHGVPESSIGLKHTRQDASEPSTGNESRLFQLVTHQRIRSGRDFDLFGEHEGIRRPLCIYDETLMRSDTFAFSERSMRKGRGLLAIELEGRNDPLSMGLLCYLEGAERTILAALAGLRVKGANDNANGIAVDLEPLEEHVVESYRNAVRCVSGGLGQWAQELDSLLSISQEQLQVLTAEQGGGVVAVREAVPVALRDVVILDASTAVRELVRLDPTVETGQSFTTAELKTYQAVEVHQLLSAGGRGSIEKSFNAKAREARGVSNEVRDIIRSTSDTAKAYLVFSFLPRRGGVDVLDALRQDLARAGVDLNATTPEGNPRFSFLTWGNETGLNGYEFCDVVIMAGVLHRSHLDLAAAIKGQVGHLGEPTPASRLRDLVQSEVAHVVLQGASRGSCRRITNGKAHAMRLYLIHRDAGLRTLLERVMPGAVWHYPEPEHLTKATTEGKAVQLFGQLVAYLGGLPVAVDLVSSRAAKAGIKVETDKATDKAWTRGLELLDPDLHGWDLEKRSFVRVTEEAHGFIDQS